MARPKFDALVLWVDRFSGWITGIPTNKEGLIAERCAHLMMDKGFDILGCLRLLPQIKVLILLEDGGKLCVVG